MRDRCRSPSDLFVPFLRNAMKVYIYLKMTVTSKFANIRQHTLNSDDQLTMSSHVQSPRIWFHPLLRCCCR